MSEFVVRPFAFMRLTHDALRVGFAELGGAIESGDLAGARERHAALTTVIALHAAQEERVFFPLLDERFDKAVAEAGLRDLHVREHGLESAFASALASGDLAAAGEAFTAWNQSFEDHLKREEDVMMPLTEKVDPTLEGRARAVKSIMDLDWERLKSVQLPYVVSALARTKPLGGPVRMFVSAVQTSAAGSWGELEPIVRASLSAEQASQLAAWGHLSAS